MQQTASKRDSVFINMRCRATFYVCLFLAAVDAQRLSSECGTAVARGRPTIVNGVQAKQGAFPWHVGIYRNNGTGYYDQICAGTLISPDIVISAAHCFHDDRYGKVERSSNYMIAAGKYYRPYYWPEPHVQKSPIKAIEKAKKYIGLGGNYAADISLIRLKNRLNITELVKPVCIDWDNVHEGEQLRRGQIGKVMGWGVTEIGEPSNDLQEINLPFIPYDECSAAIPEDFQGFISPTDKFCAGYLNGSSVCTGDSGGGLCFKNGRLWYLRGVVSASPSGGDPDLPCNNDQYAAFTNVGNFLEWIRAAYDNRVGIGNRSPNDCVVPKPLMGGSFEVSCHGECDVGPGSVVPISSILIHRCTADYILKGDAASLCTANGWNSFPTCIKSCQPLASFNEDFVCEYKGRIILCDSRMEPGTKAFLTCPNFYKISGTEASNHEEMTCLEKGEWDRPTLRCVPVCGRPPNSEGIFSRDEDGDPIQYSSLPWDVSIILSKSATVRNVSQISGTLIKPNLVISDADISFFSNDDGHGYDIANFTVTTHYYDFNASTRYYEQDSLVESIDLIRINDSNVNGIALLRLVTPFGMSTWVGPICMDWDNRLLAQQLRKGDVGKVATNFLEIEGSVSKRTEIEVAYVPRDSCLSTIEEGDKTYVPIGKFCAERLNYTKPSSSCDYPLSGSGLAFESDGVWYLRGVFSRCIHGRTSLTRPADITYNYLLIQDVGHYLGSIRDAYDAS